jgi:hypothetical protein
MTTIESITASTIQLPEPEFLADESQLAPAAFLARYSGRTLDAYRHDLGGFFRWAADIGLVVLDATRPQVELFRCSMEERGLAASTIDRRLSTVCGFYRFAHIDGWITSNTRAGTRRGWPGFGSTGPNPSFAKGTRHEPERWRWLRTTTWANSS